MYGSINVVLTKDITVNDKVLENGALVSDTSGLRIWNPIGVDYSPTPVLPYGGIFDGNHKTISGLYFNNIDSQEGRSIGVIGINKKGSLVKDLTLTDSWFYGYVRVAGIVGSNNGTITGCVNEASVINYFSYCGGITGWNTVDGTVTRCINRGTISGYGVMGGIAGYNQGGTVELCGNEGDLSASWGHVGGIAGETKTYPNINGSSRSVIRNCWNTGDIGPSGSNTIYFVGGIVGNNTQSEVENCWSTGDVTAKDHVGGIVGKLTGDASVKNCYSLAEPTDTIVEDESGTPTITYVEAKTSDGFTYGEVAYLLRTRAAEGTDVWGQNIDNGETVQTVPVLNGADVYYVVIDCIDTMGYSNANVPKTDHSITKTDAVAPTCEDDGSIECYACSVCLKAFADEAGTDELTAEELVVPATGHSYSDNGFCTNVNNGAVCDAYEPATLVTEDNYAELGLTEGYVGYYAIANAGQLYWFADKVDNENATYGSVNVVLTKDITVNEGTVTENSSGLRAWNPIGYFLQVSNDANIMFNGIFDGNGKTISGLYFNGASGVALIAAAGENAVVKNVTLTNSCFRASTYVGAIVAQNYGSVTGCLNQAAIKCGSSTAGGVVGYNYGTVEQCGNTGVVNSDWIIAGGVVGDNEGTVRNCWNTGDVHAMQNYAGGIVGYHEKYSNTINDVILENCWSTGSVTCTNNSSNGGIVGRLYAAEVRNCYTTMSKVVGENEGGTITNVENKNTTAFDSGEVAYLLRTRAAAGTDVWGQDLDNGKTVQTVPTFTGADVYYCWVTTAARPSIPQRRSVYPQAM